MKKEYHYTISRTDRIYLIAFVVFLLGWELVKGIIPVSHKEYTFKPRDEHARNESMSWEKKKKDRPAYKSYNKWPEKRYIKADGSGYPKLEPPSSPLEIDSATVEELRAMGFSNKVAYNITKFIAAGGRISSPDALMKIYGMDSIQLKRASPYIIYSERSGKINYTTDTTGFSKKRETNIIDLNSATPDELESLPGIGKVLAERIVKFRVSLGGFLDPAQLKDCYGISPELYERIKDRLVVIGSPVKIRINSEDLLNINHPYLPKKIIKVISAYVKHHGPLHSPDDLRKAYPGDTVWIEKALPYLDFETE